MDETIGKTVELNIIGVGTIVGVRNNKFIIQIDKIHVIAPIDSLEPYDNDITD